MLYNKLWVHGYVDSSDAESLSNRIGPGGNIEPTVLELSWPDWLSCLIGLCYD